MNRCRHLIPERFTNDFILESIEFLLKHNNFVFNDVIYNQLIGAAMGSSFISFYACVSIGYLEETSLFPRLNNMINDSDIQIIEETYKQFMDDGIVFLPLIIMKFLALLNSMHINIIFTLEDSEKVIVKTKSVEVLNFLDINTIT